MAVATNPKRYQNQAMSKPIPMRSENHAKVKWIARDPAKRNRKQRRAWAAITGESL